jgi:hypothetical protein
VAQVLMGAFMSAMAAQPAFAAPPAGATPAAPATPSVAAAASEAAVAAAEAQDPAPAATSFWDKVELTGLVDTYYTYNFNEPATGTFTKYRNFDVKHNQFSVSLLEVALAKAATAEDRIGFRFDLNYGQTAQIFNTDPLDNNNMLNVQQAYVSFLAPVGSGLTFEVGKFVTPIGTEPTESHLNNNYSRTYLYAYGPYYHVGARIAYTFSPKVSIGAMVVNGWNSTGDANAGKSVGVGVTITPMSKLTIIQNVLVGPERPDDTDNIRTYSDTNIAVTATDKVTAGLNYVWAKDGSGADEAKWQGLALYLKGQITPMFALAPRFGWLDDQDGFAFAEVPQAAKEFTMTAEIKHPAGLITKFEYRRDWSDVDVFEKNGLPTDNQNTFTVGFVVPFSSKK